MTRTSTPNTIGQIASSTFRKSRLLPPGLRQLHQLNVAFRSEFGMARQRLWPRLDEIAEFRDASL